MSRVRDFHPLIPDEDFPVEESVATRWHEVSSPRDDVNIPRMATDSSLLVVQYCQKLLCEPGLTKIERACCIALLMTLLGGGSCDGFLPEIRTQDIEQYILELMSISLDEHDEHTANLLAWVCLSVAAAVVVSPENGSSSPLECDPICWDLLGKVIAYFRRSTTPTLSSTKAIMRRFILTGACERVLEGAWHLEGRHPDISQGWT